MTCEELLEELSSGVYGKLPAMAWREVLVMKLRIAELERIIDRYKEICDEA